MIAGRQWDLVPALEGFPRFRDQWSVLSKSYGNHLLLDLDFVEPLIKYFASSKTFLAVSRENVPPSLVLLEEDRLGFWHTFQPSQAPIGLLLLSPEVPPTQQIDDLIRSLPGYVLGVSLMQQDPEFSGFLRELLPGHCEVLDYIPTARLTVSGTFEEYWSQRSKNLTHNLERQRRRLAGKGMRLELHVDRDPQKVVECIADYGKLEGAGWKGELGTAIVPENVQGQFYTELLQRFCERGEGVIYRLKCDGQTIASDLCIQRNGTMIVLKITYDEGLKGVSSSLLIREEIVQRLFNEHDIQVVEFYGRVRDWHRKWTNEIRSMFHVNVYRNTLVSHGKHHFKKAIECFQGRKKRGLQNSSSGSPA